jgi:hypothetical protein
LQAAHLAAAVAELYPLTAMSIRSLLIASLALVLAGCTHKEETTSRAEQARAFQHAFGFPPPADVVEIAYRSESAWALNLGGHLSIMRFTLVTNVVEKIKSQHGLVAENTSVASVNKLPQWWQEPSPGTRIYRSATNGLVRLMWMGTDERFVYYQEFNVD